MEDKKILDISWGTILKISIAVIFIYFLFLIKDLIIWFVFALVISILFEPVIGLLTRKRIPRVASVVFVYLFIFGTLSYLLFLSLPFFISEIQNFSEALPQQIPGFFERISPIFKQLGIETFESFDTFVGSFRGVFEEMARNIFSTLIVLFGGILAAFFTISMAIFLSLEKGLMEKGLVFFFPKRYEGYLSNLWKKSKEKVTGWFLMRIIGVVFVGLSSFLAFKSLGVNYPLSLAAVAGIFDFIPIIGPMIAMIVIFMIVSVDSALKAVFVFAAFGIIQLIENGILLPVLAKRIIKIPPIVILAALFIGGKLWGALGAILFIPLVAIMFEFLKDFLKEKKEELFSGSQSKNPLE